MSTENSKTTERPGSIQVFVPLPIIESCDGCGACCMEMNSPPFIGRDDPEFQTLPKSIQDDYLKGMEKRDADGWPDGVPCFWLDLDTRKCKQYQNRPEICRNGLERNDDGCRHWRKEFRIQD